eukprot:3791348-Amphidinium_carterae.1
MLQGSQAGSQPFDKVPLYRLNLCSVLQPRSMDLQLQLLVELTLTGNASIGPSCQACPCARVCACAFSARAFHSATSQKDTTFSLQTSMANVFQTFERPCYHGVSHGRTLTSLILACKRLQ